MSEIISITACWALLDAESGDVICPGGLSGVANLHTGLNGDLSEHVRICRACLHTVSSRVISKLVTRTHSHTNPQHRVSVSRVGTCRARRHTLTRRTIRIILSCVGFGAHADAGR